MKLTVPLLMLLLSGCLAGCATYCGPNQVAAIVPGTCYRYEHQHRWWQLVGRERINPFTYQQIGYLRRGVLMKCRSVHQGVLYTDTLRMKENVLRRFSVVVPCAALDSLAQLD